MKLIAIFLSSFLAAAAARAQTPAIEAAEILWAGTYRAQVVGTVEQPSTASGRTNQLANIVKLEATTTVPARLGTSFGFEYRLSGEPQGSPATIDVVVILPKAGLFNPATQKRFHREKWRPSPNRIGAATIVGYLFEKEWEAVPGIWKFQIWHGGRKLAEQSFCVVSDRKTEPEGRDPSHDDPCHSAATA